MTKNKSSKSFTAWRVILILFSVIALLKIVFIEYSLDEEYQLMMAYRFFHGDGLFNTMWEPHQTSAFMCIGLMWVYKLVTGTFTGVLLFMRGVTALIQAGLSFYVYKVFKKFMNEKYAFLLGVAYFNLVPKLIQIPEFGSQQVWFFTLMMLPLMSYYFDKDAGKKYGLILVIISGIAMALEVLSYPTTLILYPFYLIYIGICSGKKRIRDLLVSVASCGACALVWFIFVLPGLGIKDFIRNFKYSISLDLTHELDGATAGKGTWIVETLIYIGIVYVAIFIISALITLIVSAISKKNKGNGLDKKQFILMMLGASVAVSSVYQIVLWLVFKKPYEYTQIHLMFSLIAGTVALFMYYKKTKPFMGIVIGSVLSIFIVVYTSDLSPYYAIPHGAFGAITTMGVLGIAASEAFERKGFKKFFMYLMIMFVLTITIGKAFTFRGGRAELKMPWDVRGIMKHGIAAGVMSDYMNAYIYNSNFEDFNAYINDGDKVLIVTNMVQSMGTSPYTFKDVDICHYSIVDPTAYDERLLMYWDLYPDKKPNVIIVDCWYGRLMEDPDSYIMKYIENEFGYSSVTDGKYIRIYRQ